LAASLPETRKKQAQLESELELQRSLGAITLRISGTDPFDSTIRDSQRLLSSKPHWHPDALGREFSLIDGRQEKPFSNISLDKIFLYRRQFLPGTNLPYLALFVDHQREVESVEFQRLITVRIERRQACPVL
jgi:hypothetical protein